MTGDNFTIDTAAVGRIAAAVSGAGQSLFDSTDALQVSPDAGRSSDELATAFQDLSAVIAGLAGSIGDLSDNADRVAGNTSAADDQAADLFVTRPGVPQ